MHLKELATILKKDYGLVLSDEDLQNLANRLLRITRLVVNRKSKCK